MMIIMIMTMMIMISKNYFGNGFQVSFDVNDTLSSNNVLFPIILMMMTMMMTMMTMMMVTTMKTVIDILKL